MKMLPNDPAFFKAENDDLFGHGMMEIVVGEPRVSVPRVKFDVHKKALTQVSEFFARTFHEDTFKNILGLMDLPDEDPDTFRFFVKWAYTNFDGSGIRTNIAHLEELFRMVSRKDLLRLYLLAVKLEAATLQDDLVYLFYDRLARGFKKMANLGVDDEFLAYLDAHLEERTALYKLLSRALAYRMATNPYHGIAFRYPPEPHGSQLQGVKHPYPSELSKAVMKYAAENMPECLVRSIMKDFFDLHARPIVGDFRQGVGPLAKFLVAEPASEG